MKVILVVAWAFTLFSTNVQSFVVPTSLGSAVASRHAPSRCNAATTVVQQRRAISPMLFASSRPRSQSLSMSTTTIPASFNLPVGIAVLGLAITGLGTIEVGFPVTVVGLLLAFQATRVVFEFDDEAMEVKIGGDPDEDLKSSGENAFVGGESRWKYNTWTNWEVYPSEKLPVLMYFKETQTKPEGQIHFFPFIMEPEKLLAEVRARVPLPK